MKKITAWSTMDNTYFSEKEAIAHCENRMHLMARKIVDKALAHKRDEGRMTIAQRIEDFLCTSEAEGLLCMLEQCREDLRIIDERDFND